MQLTKHYMLLAAIASSLLSNLALVSGKKTWSYLDKSGIQDKISDEYREIDKWLNANVDMEKSHYFQLDQAREYYNEHKDEIVGESLRLAWERFVNLDKTTHDPCDYEAIKVLVDNMNDSGMRLKLIQQRTLIANIVDSFARRHALGCHRFYLDQLMSLKFTSNTRTHSLPEKLTHHLQLNMGPMVLTLDKYDKQMQDFFWRIEKGSLSDIAKVFARTVALMEDEYEHDFDGKRDLHSENVKAGVAMIFDSCKKYVNVFGKLAELVEFDAKIYSRYDYFSSKMTTAWTTVQVCKLLPKRNPDDIVNKIASQLDGDGTWRKKIMEKFPTFT